MFTPVRGLFAITLFLLGGSTTVVAKEPVPQWIWSNKQAQQSTPDAAVNWNQVEFDDSGWSVSAALGPFGTTPPWGETPLQGTLYVAVEVPPESTTRDRTGPFELLDGDRVALIGNTLFEREQSFGDWEHEFTRRYPDRRITFRNLGWSGDRPSGISRKRFGNVDEGFQHLRKSIELVRPTVVLINYGANAAHEGEAGHERFFAELDGLFALLEPTGARLVLVSPIEHEQLGEPLPNPSRYNEQVRALRGAMKDYAKQRRCDFADLVEHFDRASTSGSGPVEPAETWTSNGIHLSPYGYWRSAPEFSRALGIKPHDPWFVQVNAKDRTFSNTGAQVQGVETDSQGVTIKILDRQLPPASAPKDGPAAKPPYGGRVLQVADLQLGKYQLSIEGRAIAAASAEEWANGVEINAGPSFDQSEELREVIVKKNELFFHRYRPQNETYLLLFRKHEQGNNAVEIPQFDPLIAAEEARIAKLRQPIAQTYRLEQIKE